MDFNLTEQQAIARDAICSAAPAVDAAIYARQGTEAHLLAAAEIWMHASARLLECYDAAGGRPEHPYSQVIEELRASLGKLQGA